MSLKNCEILSKSFTNFCLVDDYYYNIEIANTFLREKFK